MLMNAFVRLRLDTGEPSGPVTSGCVAGSESSIPWAAALLLES